MILEDIRGLDNIDVIKGNGRHYRRNKEIDPAMIHFNIHTQDIYPYLREMKRLFGKSKFSASLSAYVLSLYRKTICFVKERILLKILFFFWGLLRKIFPKRI
jgi:hypothetical protein